MPNSEKIISPGVFTTEIDQSFLPSAIADIGAAIVGPTTKGPILVPVVVNSYAEYQARFGGSFRSGSSVFRYLTDHAAEEYLRHQGKLTVVRVASGSFTNASAYIAASGLGDITSSIDGCAMTEGNHATTCPNGYLSRSIEYNQTSHDDYNSQGINAGRVGETGGSRCAFALHTLSHGANLNSLSLVNISSSTELGGPNEGSNGILPSASMDSLRWEIPNVDYDRGNFTLLIRRGDDLRTRKQTLETWNNVNLNPNSPNYIAKRIGDQYLAITGQGTADPYLQPNGDYPNKSKYVRVEVIQGNLTPDYIDENGDIRTLLDGSAICHSASLPPIQSGSFMSGSHGALCGTDVNSGDPWAWGSTTSPAKYYEFINEDNSQGFNINTTKSGIHSAQQHYLDALSLLKNQDEYDINLLLTPGIIGNFSGHGTIVQRAIEVCEDRGDAFYILDAVESGKNITDVTSQAKTYDSNYAATYWPWVQINDSQVGIPRYVPPSVVLGGVYGFTDRISQPWFAPAGLSRGTMGTVIQAQRRLTHGDRDTLYNANVNPIATFPAEGVTVWGQKTLQKKSSALDRVNVRRLLIKVKKFIASTSRFLLFEQNNVATRNRFLNIVNPYLEQVQANSGLTAFRVVMDGSNNTPDVIDRNILYGQIFIQPTRTAEFIVLDFTVQPTGATFPE